MDYDIDVTTSTIELDITTRDYQLSVSRIGAQGPQGVGADASTISQLILDGIADGSISIGEQVIQSVMKPAVDGSVLIWIAINASDEFQSFNYFDRESSDFVELMSATGLHITDDLGVATLVDTTVDTNPPG